MHQWARNPTGSSLSVRGFVPLARYDRYAESGAPRLEHAVTGEDIPFDSPGFPEHFERLRGTWAIRGIRRGGPKDPSSHPNPSTGEPLGPDMVVPTDVVNYNAVGETPDSTRAVITWHGSAQVPTETAVFDIASGELLLRGLDDLDTSLALDDDQFVGIAQDHARRYDIRTLEPISTLPRAVGGGFYASVSTDGRTLLTVGASNALQTLDDLTADIALAAPVDSPASTFRLIEGTQAESECPADTWRRTAKHCSRRFWTASVCGICARLSRQHTRARLPGANSRRRSGRPTSPARTASSTCAALTS